jgi:hypothetical protein
MQQNIDLTVRNASEGSVSGLSGQLLQRAGIEDNVSVGEQLIGISGKDLKENFKAAFKKDKNLFLPLRILKGAARATGLALGITINLAVKVAAFTSGIAGGTLAVLVYTIAAATSSTGRSKLWDNPRQALLGVFAAGTVIGAINGATLGFFGNFLIKSSLSMKHGSFGDQIGKAIADNTIAAALGASVGTLISFANPLFIRAAWVKDTSI